MLKIAISPCPNDVFIFAGLILGHVQMNDSDLHFDYFDIETLNEKSLLFDYDLMKISYANYPRCSSNYSLLPSGGALGRGVGPLLLTGGASWNPENEVMVPGRYTTANFLLDFWVQRSLKKKFVPFNSLYDVLKENSDAQGVVIHEKRFTYAADGLNLIQDLGAYWEEKTGCPIPLGCVIAKKHLDGTALNESIKQSLAWAYKNKEEVLDLCSRYASDMTPDVMQSHIDLYVNEFSMELGPSGESAVNFFFDQVEAKTTSA
ncbi:MAG: 1,4-dihydroxy-6-naphthoate synthase [Cyanobacteria bacterium SZAS-4]|nr:1,4-dihydroxy-6-naphthoate synthase [Cyanobacteria bacterium SZAS-4]